MATHLPITDYWHFLHIWYYINKSWTGHLYLDTKIDYLRFKNKKNITLHRYKYESFYKFIKVGNQVHHIDANHFNNEIENLIELTKEQHHLINHGRIRYGDWNSGLNELKRIGISEDKFPKEILNKLKRKWYY